MMQLSTLPRFVTTTAGKLARSSTRCEAAKCYRSAAWISYTTLDDPQPKKLCNIHAEVVRED